MCDGGGEGGVISGKHGGLGMGEEGGSLLGCGCDGFLYLGIRVFLL